MLEYLLNTSTNVFCQYCPRTQARRPPKWSTPEEHLPSFLKIAHHHTGQNEYYKKAT